MKRIAILLIAIAMVIIPLSLAEDVFAAEGTNVDHHTQQEISTYLSESGVSFYDETSYSVEPVINTVRGQLSNESKNGALKILNNIRYIAGLNPVSLDDSYGDLAQAAAFVNASIGRMTHYPDQVAQKPAEMSDEDWTAGVTGAGKTNLARGQSTLNLACLAWTFDESSSNIPMIGHRRWCLNPGMGKTGFGAAEWFYAMYSFDRSASSSQTNVAWPAENMPVEYFNKDIPWSLSTGRNVTAANVVVTLTRLNDGKVWTFNGTETYSPSNQKYFNVNNEGYGQIGCIIFRPDGIDGYKAGDRFNVRITGAGSTTIEYTVNFFNAVRMTGIRFDPQEGTVTAGSTRQTYIEPVPYECAETIDQSEITYESSDTSVATVSSGGKITAVDAGTATITATYHGMTAEYSLTVKKSIYDSVGYNFTITHPVYTGSAVIPTCELRDGNKVLVEGTDYYVAAEDETIECDGKWHYVTCYGMGTYTGNIMLAYRVMPKEVTADMFSLSPQSFAYDGQQHIPGVSGTYNNMTMTRGTDYSVSSETAPITVGEHSLTITGNGNYTGTCQVNYSIQPKDIDDVQVSVGQEPLVYSGTAQIPDVVVKDGGKTLVEGEDYTLSPDEAINAGEHTITVTGINNYQGTRALTYTIAKAERPFLLPSEEYSVPYSTETLTNDILSNVPGWLFADTDLGKDLPVGSSVECTAVYGGEDAANFSNLTASVSVVRSECEHEQTELRGEVQADCQHTGYSGDIYCLDCKKLIAEGQETPKAAHTPADAVNENEHPATCLEPGSYEEVVYCSECSETMSRTTRTIAALGHDWDKWVVTTEPGCETPGEEQHVCKRNTEHKETRVVEPTGHNWGAGEITKEATVSEEGEVIFVCADCGAEKKESIPKLPDPAKQMGSDGTALGEGASAKAAEAAITGMKSDGDPKGSVFGLLKLKSTKQAKTKLTITWKKQAKAKKYVVFGNKCGAANKMKKLTETTANTFAVKTVFSNAGKKVKVAKGKYYKFIVVALDKNNNVVSTSKVIHVATKGGKIGNHKSVTTKAKKNKVTVKVKKTFRLKAKAVPASKKLKVKKHRAIVYESSNVKIATVNKSGVITGKAKGSCYVYAYAQNGVCKAIKVTVK